MFYGEKELLEEINETLDQLIQNATILQSCDLSSYQTEALLLQKMQDSLIAKFMHTQEYMTGVNLEEKLLEKIQNLRKLSPNLLQNFSKELTKNPSFIGLRPRIGRNRKRSKIKEFAYRSF
ncbi:MAG: hypothetical protein JSS09_03175 [Verrucomicrobia bacterium]|nr:hypothetical protein [Verrucomicrobiota bacterium]